MKKYYTTIKQDGSMIDEFNTEEEARLAIEQYEEEDGEANDFYEIRVGADEEVNACKTTEEFVWATEFVD